MNGLLSRLAMFTAFFLMATTAAAQSVTLSGHVLPVLQSARLRDPQIDQSDRAKAATEPLALTVILNRNDPAGFEQLLARQSDPASSDFRQFLPANVVSDRFGPSAGDYSLVKDYFVGQGFTILEESSNRLVLRVQSTHAQVEKALALELHDYLGSDGLPFRANDRDPALPGPVAARVQAIVGLTDLAVPVHLNSTFRSLDRCMRNANGIYTPDLQLACTLTYALDAALYDIACAFTVMAIQADLGLTTGIGGIVVGGAVNKITGCHFVYPGGPTPISPYAPNPGGPTALPGAGQIIGLLEFDSFLSSDVAGWLALVGFAPSQIDRLSEVKLSGGAALGPDQDEVLVDIAQVSFLSPGANVVVYDTPFALGSFQALFNRMLTDGVDVVSNSWTYCENQTAPADLVSMNSVLASLAASGASVLNASGDTGSTCLNGSPNTIGVPSGSPNATAVGGSSYSWGPAPLYGTERWWDGSGSNPPTGQGGFGVSQFYPRPAYQTGFTGSNFRSVPDLVAAADPVLNGKVICQAAAGGCPSGLVYGGTSVAAPLWAAIIANLNAGLGHNLGFLNPQLYALAGTPALHGPVQLASDFAHVGLGSPNLAQLYVKLSGTPVGAASATRSTLNAIPATVAADGAEIGTVVVQLRDVVGLPVAGKTIGLSVSGSSNAEITPATAMTTADNGAVQFSVSDATVETVTLAAVDTSDGLALGSIQLAFVPPPAVAGSIAAFPSPVTANGSSTASVLVILKDGRGLPAAGKTVVLQTGAAHATVSGPSPAVTNGFGLIEFSVRDLVAEMVTFSAIDVDDGQLAVPGSASVDFIDSSNAGCAVTPSPANGYSMSAFASGFVAENFFYGGVNWGGCPGASNPTFDTSGHVIVTDFRSGDVFRLGLAGGAASSPIANGGITLGQPVQTADGRLYATLGTASSGLAGGAVVELSPANGSTLRVVASGLTCPSGLAVDPASGDLFFVNQCVGGGLDNPSLYRLTDPSDTDPNRPTAVVVYTTLPGSPNGTLSFSPDGTLYVAGSYTLPAPPLLKVSGTAAAQPATVTAVPGVSTLYWVTVGEVLPDGTAKSLILLSPVSPNPLQLVDISGPTPTMTPLTLTAMSSGTIGPDGCLYATASDTVYKITPDSGACRFSATNPSPALALSPPSVAPNPPQGSSRTLVAQLNNSSVLPGQTVAFQVLGANVALGVVPLDAGGRAEFSYIGAAAGTDTVYARTVRGQGVLLSNPARIVWAAGNHPTTIDLSLSSSGGIAGTSVVLRARLTDLSGNPSPPVGAATLSYTLSGPACAGSSDATGVASCNAILPAAGIYTLTASFAGSSGLLPSTSSRIFFVTAPPNNDVIFADGFE